MNSEMFQKLAEELSKAGDNDAASVVCFVGSFHLRCDKENLRALAEFSKKLDPELPQDL